MSAVQRLPETKWPSASAGAGPHRHLYIIQEGDSGPIKIGVAANAGCRRTGLQAGNPRPIFLRAVFTGTDKRLIGGIERRVHAHFADRRVVLEWFAVEPQEAIAFIEQSYC